MSDELGTEYEFRILGGALVAAHFRHGETPRTWTVSEFTSRWWFLRSLTSERDGNGRVMALVVNLGERSRNIRFERRNMVQTQ